MTVGESPIRNVCLAVLGVSLMALAAAYLLRSRLWPSPSLDGVDRLLASRRFLEADRAISNYLRVYPDSPRANFLMAQSCLARDDQKPKLALEHLARIHAVHPGVRAMILLNAGKAHSALGRNDRAEAAWKEALRLEPGTPEVGWDLLGLYYVQGRREDARRLGLTLHAVEPDPRDRAQLLLELLRQDAQPIGPDSLIRTLEPLVRANADDLQTSLALGLALIRNSRLDEGLSILRATAAGSGDDPDAWKGWLSGLDEAGKFDELSEALARLPAKFASDPRFDRYRGAVFQYRQDWPRAADAYLLAWRTEPSDLGVLYRLGRALKAVGRGREAETFDRRVRGAREAKDEMLPLYEEANAVKDLGIAPHADLYHRLADLRERMGRSDEAVAWHRLVLRDQPDDAASRGAIARLTTVNASARSSRESELTSH